MDNVLPELFEGHAPITLQNAFHDALEALEGWMPGEGEPAVALGERALPVSRLFTVMTQCTDLLPRRTLAVLESILAGKRAGISDGAVYADAARLVRPVCLQRQRTPCVRPAVQACHEVEGVFHSYAGA